MPKKIKKTPFQPWESVHEFDSFARLPKSLLESPVFQSLTSGQKVLFLYMKLQYYNSRNKPSDNNKQFFFNKGLYNGKYHLYTNDAQFRKDRDALIQKGFITCAESGRWTRTKSIYEFSDRWTAGAEHHTDKKQVVFR